ncbi:MAG: glycosyltransferase family 2 protein [Lachnospiraceae bacterium]|nr:glycosyltransferase family 2 protein [Lachnospiraceae bacterium]
MLRLCIPACRNMLDMLRTSGKIKADSFLLLVDDGSDDGTWKAVVDAHLRDENVRGIRLSRNFGQQNALYAGLMKALPECDVSVTMDADLQDDIAVLPEMFEKYRKGCEIVFGVRNSRPADTIRKRLAAEFFYRCKKLIDPGTIPDHADYRLMSRRVMESLALYKEQNLYLRGIAADMGYKSACVYYERKPRKAGKSSYTFLKMAKLAGSGLLCGSGGFSPAGCFLGATAVLMQMRTVTGIWARAAHRRKREAQVDVNAGFCVLSVLGKAGMLFLGEAVLKESRRRPRYLICDSTD